MTPQPDFIHPPRIAAWLVTLFASAEDAESIVGDLAEEFSCLVSESGVAFAQRWYWRQTVKTLADLMGSAFRVAPWSTSAAVAGGFLLLRFASRFSVHEMQAFLDTHRIYELHPDAYLFWIKFPLQAGRVILCIFAGASVAFAAKRRELAATVSLALIQLALFGSALLAVIAAGREWVHWLWAMLPWNCIFSMATVVGGAIVRTRRSVAR